MTCKELMTSDPAFCVPDDNVVRVAMLMKQHDVGSIPVVSGANRKLEGMITDRDVTLRVVAEQRDYYSTRVGDVMSTDIVTCSPNDNASEVLKAMAKRQVRRIPVVDHDERLVGIISQADVARLSAHEDTAETLQAVSEPEDIHDDGSNAGLKAGLMVAGGLGLGAGLLYMLNPTAKRTLNDIFGAEE